MGGIFSTKSEKSLCTDLIPRDTDFAIMISLHVFKSNALLDDVKYKILEYLSYTRFTFSYMTDSYIYLMYKPDNKVPFIRSPCVADIISYMSSEFAIWFVKNIPQADLRMMSIDIEVEPFEEQFKRLRDKILQQHTRGVSHELVDLTEEKIDAFYEMLF